MSDTGYSSAVGVEAAIRDAARRAAAADPTTTVGDRVSQEHFRRFLSRVFSETDETGWILKGGTGMLARVASARATRDVDLFSRKSSLDRALTDLRRLADVDLGDYFRFEYTGHETAVGGQQAYAEGYHVRFDIYAGANKRGSLNIDLVVNAVVTDDPLVRPPANGLDLPRLTSHDYRLYPVVDQIADKVCATLARYSDTPSTREWDLVDLIVLATTEDVHADRLHRALRAEARVRDLELPAHFAIPTTWGRRYAKDARAVPACDAYRTVDLAADLISSFLDPVLRNEVAGRTWLHKSLEWH